MWYGQFKLLGGCPNSKEESEKRKPPHIPCVLLDYDLWQGPANTDVSSCCCSPDAGYCNSFPTGFVFFQLKENVF